MAGEDKFKIYSYYTLDGSVRYFVGRDSEPGKAYRNFISHKYEDCEKWRDMLNKEERSEADDNQGDKIKGAGTPGKQD